jgi:hypothetical protein
MSIVAGTRVELVEQIYGYETGAAGVVVHAAPNGEVLVRFDSTGHAMYVDPHLFKETPAPA